MNTSSCNKLFNGYESICIATLHVFLWLPTVQYMYYNTVLVNSTQFKLLTYNNQNIPFCWNSTSAFIHGSFKISEWVQTSAHYLRKNKNKTGQLNNLFKTGDAQLPCLKEVSGLIRYNHLVLLIQFYQREYWNEKRPLSLSPCSHKAQYGLITGCTTVPLCAPHEENLPIEMHQNPRGSLNAQPTSMKAHIPTNDLLYVGMLHIQVSLLHVRKIMQLQLSRIECGGGLKKQAAFASSPL